MEQTFVARRDRLKVMDGFVHTGEAFPAGDVTDALRTLGWVTTGAGVLPADEGTHAGFADAELAALGKAPKAKVTAKAPKAKAGEADEE